MADEIIRIRFGDDDQQEYEFSQKSDVSEEVPLGGKPGDAPFYWEKAGGRSFLFD